MFLRALVGGAGSTILLSFLESISHRYRQTPAWVLAVDLRPAFGQALLYPVPHPGPGPCRARVFARGRTEYWDAYRTPEAQPQIRLHIQLWPQQIGDLRLIQYRDRFTDNRIRTDDTIEEQQPTA